MNAEFIFSPMMGQISDGWSDLNGLLLLIAAVLGMALAIGSMGGFVFLLHFLFTLPMRRAERARLFLDLLEDALNRGQSAEEMILSLARGRDPAPGARFYLLAAHIENGLRFGDALKKVPRFLPPQISAMLAAGENLGDIRRVLPACGEILRDRPAGVRSAIHYVILVVVLFTPVFIVDVLLTATYVIPEFKMVAAGMNFRLGALAIWVFGNTSWLVVFQIAMFSLLMLVVMIYVGGPDFARRFQFRGFPIADGIAWRIPWKRKRLQRTVSAMLAVLLDGGVPEAVAVRLAGDCTANQICRGRAQRVVAALQQGVKLDDAMRAFDHSGEFHWRLANTARARGGFLQGLRGWHESLDAKAFQQEEAAAHIVTTGVVILNGLLVALIAIAMFGIITTLLDNAVSNL